jgi:hypothetical protein
LFPPAFFKSLSGEIKDDTKSFLENKPLGKWS